MMLTALATAPAEAGAPKRRFLAVVRKLASGVVVTGEVIHLCGLVAWQACDKAIQRDLDKERNLREAENGARAEPERAESSEGV